MKGYGPADPLQSPRFAGISTFLRLPHTTRLEDVDVAFIGLPFDTGVSFRAGARFGPKAVREGSSRCALTTIQPTAWRCSSASRRSTTATHRWCRGFTDRSYDKMQEALGVIDQSGVLPICFGGDHGVLLPELRAAAAAHGPLALLLFDAHSDTNDEDFGEKYTHGTAVRRAVEEDSSTRAGLRSWARGVACTT